MLKEKSTRENKEKKRIKPELPGGFRDYSPADAIARLDMIETIRTTFERFGFDPLETPAVERTEILTGGDEDSGKIIFNVKGSREKVSDTSLRFDLTVPLARFVAANPEIPKPFKRYQIGNVWRGESPQAGRYREFMQADIDIVGAVGIEVDAEIIEVIYRTLCALCIGDFVIRINDRTEAIKDILKFNPSFSTEDINSTLIIQDHWDKITRDELQQKLIGVGWSSSDSGSYIEFLPEKEKDPPERFNNLVQNLMSRGVSEDKVMYDATVVRGLGYYTGLVFETTLTNYTEIGSIFSGGRYDNLVMQFTGQPIPAVGASIGVDRLYVALEKLGKLEKKQTKTQVFIMNLDENLQNEYYQFASDLRNAGFNTAIYLGDDRAFNAQLAYAVKKDIPYLLIYGDNEKQKNVVIVKNLQTREQKEISKDQLLSFFQQ